MPIYLLVWENASRQAVSHLHKAIALRRRRLRQWVRSPIPSNSIASVYNLIDDGRRRKALGDDVEIDIDVIRRLKEADGAMVGLVGVQTNQFPRAVDIGRKFLDAGIPQDGGGLYQF